MAVEPHPENYRALLKGVQLNGLTNVIALNVAAYDQNTQLELFFGSHSGTHSLKWDRARARDTSRIKVKAKALDAVLPELGITRIDWIKVDVEGSEFEVLMGLRRTLMAYNPKVIVEVECRNQEKVENLMNVIGYARANYLQKFR